MAGVLPDVVVLVRVLSRCRSRSLWAVRLQRAVGVCVCCVLFVVRQELLVVVLVPCICAESWRAHVFMLAMVRAARPGSACVISACLARRVTAPEACRPAM